MKKIAFLFVLFLAASCSNEKTTNQDSTPTISNEAFELDLTKNEELEFEKMRIYPIIGSEEHIAAHADLAGYKNLKEAMNNKRFRITEAKPFGGFHEIDAVNNLTVQNKSTDTIYLMAGDVVKGGKQDRVLAQDMVLPPRTLTNIPVFCVEHGRWAPLEEDLETIENESTKDKKIIAFSGYYNVVSNDIRKTVKYDRDQTKVWAAVGNITTANNANSSTETYTALETSEDFTLERNEYLSFFGDKMDRTENVIGMVVVSGNEILGTDIFNHPNLFKKQFKVLLHSYVTDAVTKGKEVKVSDNKMKNYGIKIKRDYKRKLTNEKENEVKFRYDGKIVHFSHL